MEEKLFCPKCQKQYDEKNFYTYKDGKKTEFCKKCLTMHIDNFDPETFLWILKKMDVPYIPEEWNVLRDRAYAKDPRKMNGMSVFGKYLSKMKLKQWKEYGWEDSEKLSRGGRDTSEAFYEEHPEIKAMEEEAKRKFEAGEISEAEYQTFVSTETLNKDAGMYYTPPTGGPYDGAPYSGSIGNPYNENNFMAAEQINFEVDLTEEDKLYLAMKWGRLYQPHEWVELEKNYNEMMEGFDIQDPDTINTLKHLCKTNLKMNQAIDSGDVDGYQKLARVYDTFRKSAKFTAAQNKKDKEDFVDCVGNLVVFCEKNGGKIPRTKIDTPLDIVDQVISDMKEYNRSLIYEDKSLAQQIEQYLRNLENEKNRKKDKKEAKEKGLDEVLITDEDFMKHKQQIEDDKAADLALVYSKEEE